MLSQEEVAHLTHGSSHPADTITSSHTSHPVSPSGPLVGGLSTVTERASQELSQNSHNSVTVGGGDGPHSSPEAHEGDDTLQNIKTDTRIRVVAHWYLVCEHTLVCVDTHWYDDRSIGLATSRQSIGHRVWL